MNTISKYFNCNGRSNSISNVHQKDDRIQELLEQSRMNITTDLSYKTVGILEPIKTFLMEQQSQMEQKVQRILESMHEQFKLTKEYGTVQKSVIEDSNKHYLDLKYTGQRHIQEIEKRLVDELVTLRDDFDRQKRDMESLFQNQIKITQQKCVRDMEQHIQKGMTDGLRQTSELMEQSLQTKQAEIQNVCKSQQKDMAKYIQYNTTEQTKQICKQNRELYSKQCQGFRKDLQQKLDKICEEQRAYFQESKTCMEEIRTANYNYKEPPWINDTVSKKIQDQMKELHNHHQAEIKRIEAEMHSTKNIRIFEKGHIRKENCALNLCLQNPEFNRNLQNVYNDEQSQSYPGNFESTKTFSSAFHHKETRFLSPKLPQVITWKSRAIFGQTNICLKSPVATVLSQSQQKFEPSARQVHDLQAEVAITERAQPVIELHNDSLSLPIPETITQVEPSTRQLRTRSKCSNANISQTSMVEHRPNNIQADDRNSVPVSKWNKPKMKTPRKKACKRSKKNTSDLQSHNIKTKTINMQEPSALVKTIKAVPVLPQGSTSYENNIHNESSHHLICEQFSDSYSKMKCFTVNGTDSNDSSNNSSRLLSLKDISIRRKIKCDRKSPANTDVKISEDVWSSVSDILSTSVLMDLFSQDETQNTTVSSQKPNQTIWPLRRLGEKRKLCNGEHNVMQILHCSQNTGNYIANSIYYNVEC